jgi:hypothetical protein
MGSHFHDIRDCRKHSMSRSCRSCRQFLPSLSWLTRSIAIPKASGVCTRIRLQAGSIKQRRSGPGDIRAVDEVFREKKSCVPGFCRKISSTAQPVRPAKAKTLQGSASPVNRPEPGNSAISWPNRSTSDWANCTRRGSRNEPTGKDHLSAKPVVASRWI